MTPLKKVTCLLLAALMMVLVLGPIGHAVAQVPVITYYGAPVTVYSPVVPSVVYRPTTVYSVPATTYSLPSTVYSVPTTVYSAPTTVYSVPTTVYSVPTASVVYDNGPLGLGLFPRRWVSYSPRYYVAPSPAVAFPTPGVVYSLPY